MSYSYDSASQLTGITYTNGGTTLGTLTYAYDLAGRRNCMGGSLAQTALPLGISETAYNADNQLTQWGTAGLYYDPNGNMTSDGVNSYTWDSRNRLASMNFGANSFQYDALGRRISKTISGTTTNYLFDGLDIVQELSGSTPTANLLTGGIDQIFTRTDSSGAANFLTDGLGSTLALTDSSGSALAQYAYDPFGNTFVTSGSSSNSYQYTGRENDGTGMYFYRNRYYSPTLQRFTSEDPVDMAGGGPNLYAYVANNPVEFIDPLGLDKQPQSKQGCTPSVFNPSCKPPTKPSCPAVFRDSLFGYSPSGLPQAPAGLGPEDAATATAAAFAARHVIQRGLAVPLRSSIVRNVLLVGDVASDLLSYGPVIYSEVNALIDEGAAWKSGACTTIWSSN